MFNLNTNASNIAYANLDNSQKVSIYDENNEFGNIKNNQYDLPNFKIQKRELPPVIIQYHINSAPRITAEQYYNQTYSLPDAPFMRELTEQEADILEQTFKNYYKNQHSLPDGKPE